MVSLVALITSHSTDTSPDRNKVVSDPYEIVAWLGFDFEARGDKYSKQKYHWYHFSGTDFDAKNNRNAIFKIQGDHKGWSESVDDEGGNADFLMFADLDYSHPEVCEDVKNWGKWIINEVGLRGFRLDAVQHFSQRFTKEWIEEIRKEYGDVFYVGEFWTGNVEDLKNWVHEMDRLFSLYDSPLLNNFSNLSKSEAGDLRKVFDKTLVQDMPVNAVVCITTPPTQPNTNHHRPSSQTTIPNQVRLSKPLLKVSSSLWPTPSSSFAVMAIPAFSTATSTAQKANTRNHHPVATNWQI